MKFGIVLPLAMLTIACMCSCTTAPPPTQAKWRYGVYSESQRNVAARFSWETSHSGISCATRAAIARELGYNISDKAESSENNLTLLTLFDQLGERGWQLIHIDDKSDGTTRRYFFRRQTDNQPDNHKEGPDAQRRPPCKTSWRSNTRSLVITFTVVGTLMCGCKSAACREGYAQGIAEATAEISSNAPTLYMSGTHPVPVPKDLKDDKTGLPIQFISGCIGSDADMGRKEGHNTVILEHIKKDAP